MKAQRITAVADGARMQFKSWGLMPQLLDSDDSLGFNGYQLAACKFLKKDASNEWMNEVAVQCNDAVDLATQQRQSLRPTHATPSGSHLASCKVASHCSSKL